MLRAGLCSTGERNQMKRVVFNRKGGVGKSTITCNLAAIAASRGKNTLVIDLDSQCNSSQYLLHDLFDDGIPTIADFFERSLSFKLMPDEAESYVITTPHKKLSVIAASSELSDLQVRLEAKYKIFKLRDLLRKFESDYDEIWIDTPPALNFYTMSALVAADSCIIPFDCDDFSRRALYSLMENVSETQADHNDDLYVEGIAINQFQSRARLPTELVDQLKAEDLPVLEPYISSSVKIKESHEKALPMVYYMPKHKITQEFQGLYDSLDN